MADCRQVFGGCRGPMVIEAAAVAYVLSVGMGAQDRQLLVAAACL
jgi:hypothetical protein